MRKLLFIMIISTLSFASDYASASLFSDSKATGVGDIVTIEVMEFTEGSNESSNDGEKTSSAALSAEKGTGFLDFMPDFGFSSDLSTTFQGKGTTSRKGTLSGKLTAQIVRQLPNGNLELEGSRTVEVNGERQIMILTGVVRPQDISTNNIIYSYNIADAQIAYKGKGTVQTDSRPGVFTRFLSWLF